MWDLIFNPLVTLLTWMYAIFGNNVVLAIVVLTVIIRVVTYPLTAQQQRSAKRMQEVQPELKKLQEKFKDDREKLAQAQMQLYKEAGINPLGGCFPLLIQFPILIGLYQAIYFALANTPFQMVDLSERLLIPELARLIPLENMWLGMDLTQPPTPPLNPVYALALPALVMITTYIQFKVSMPQTQNADPNDQAAAMNRSMSTMMPLMFGFFALSFSVGLSVYFIVSNLLGIAQYSGPGKRLLERFFGDDKPKKKDNLELEVAKATATAGTGQTTSKPATPKSVTVKPVTTKRKKR
jgi:YidC/Oxa1 family membrane protein insertase